MSSGFIIPDPINDRFGINQSNCYISNEDLQLYMKQNPESGEYDVVIKVKVYASREARDSGIAEPLEEFRITKSSPRNELISNMYMIIAGYLRELYPSIQEN
jgi:hypothetical protein